MIKILHCTIITQNKIIQLQNAINLTGKKMKEKKKLNLMPFIFLFFIGLSIITHFVGYDSHEKETLSKTVENNS